MMQHLKRLLTFVFVIVVAVTTRIIVRDGIRSVLDRFTNSAGAQSDEDTPKPDAPKQGTSPLSAGGPLGAGPKAAARSAVAKANAQLSEQTGQDVPKPAGTPPAQSPTQTPTPAPTRTVAAAPATPTPASKAPATNTPAANAPTNAPA